MDSGTLRLVFVFIAVISVVSLLAVIISGQSLAYNVTKSAPHRATYITVFNRPANITINYTKVPKVLQGITPILKKPNERADDKVRMAIPVKLDPRACPNELAMCYQVVYNQQNRTTFGKNFTAVSSYVLPSTRIRTYYCMGDDTLCTAMSTNCFCPDDRINPPPMIKGEAGNCDSDVHLCSTSYGVFSYCNGNLSSCQERHGLCGCGKYAACVATKNTCIDTHNQLMRCDGTLQDCLQSYKSCFCGVEMLSWQTGCKSISHSCIKNNKTFSCYGSFYACALSFDACDC